MKNIEKFIKEKYIYILIFAIFLTINCFVPVGGDDWEISSWYNVGGIFTLFIKSIVIWKTYNGRILNNFFDMFLGKYPMVWAISSALITTLTIYYLLKLLKKDNEKLSIIITLLLFLSISTDLRMEIQLHKIGNISYGIPAFLIFILIFYILSKSQKEKNIKISYKILTVLGLCSCLFIENLTIGIIGVCCLIIFYDFVFQKKLNKPALFALIGCLIGALIMFTSPGFLNRYDSSTDGLTKIELFQKNLSLVLNQITLNQILLYFIYSISSFMSLQTNKIKHSKISLIMRIYFIMLIGVLGISILLKALSDSSYVYANLYNSWYSIFLNYNSIYSIILMISMILSIIIIINIISKKEIRYRLNILFLIALISVMPMVLSPGFRNTILCIYSLIAITAYISSTIVLNKKQTQAVILILLLFFVIRIEEYHYILHDANIITKERISLIEEYKKNRNSNILILPRYSEDIIQNLNSTYYEPAVIKYYGLPTNTRILFDDNFILDGVYVTEDNGIYKIKINLLGTDKYKYNVKITDISTGKIVFDELSENNEFKYLFEKGKIYVISTTIISENYGYIVDNINYEVNDEK